MRRHWDAGLKHIRLINLRYNSLKKVVIIVVTVQLFTLYWFFHNHYASFDNVAFGTSTITRFPQTQIEVTNTDGTPKVLASYLSAKPKLFEQSIYQNCVDFFDSLNNTNYFEMMLDQVFHPELYDLNFHDQVVVQVKERFEHLKKDVNLINDDDDIKPLMEKFKLENVIVESRLIDLMSRLRIYGKCFIQNRIKRQNEKYENALFPFVSGKLPVFHDWNGKKLDFPIYDKHQTPPFSYSFLQQLQDKYNGRGIVISIGDSLVDETCQLIRVLRFLNNTLPIQFVHNNELSEQSTKLLFETARSVDIKGPKQDALVVNIHGCLTLEFNGKFNGFNSKWMAVLFSSFEEMILMDNDLVPFINPSLFFTQFDNYNKTGTFFFRDRESFERVSKGSQSLIKQVLPSKMEHLLFDIPNFTEENLSSNNNFFKYGAKHYMESGIVVMNKRKNFHGLITSINLQITGPLANPFYGDKEIFWLGQVLSGNNNLFFNKHAAGNIGKIEDASKNSKTIKGIQPAHISPLDDHTLLWVNSGLKNCKKDTAEDDFSKIYEKKENSKFASVEDLKKFYDSPVDIEGVIIPPNSNKDWNNIIHEPSRGFHQVDNQGCGGYYWHAYSSVGTPNDPPELTKGLIVTFTDEEKSFFNEVEKVWIGI